MSYLNAGKNYKDNQICINFALPHAVGCDHGVGAGREEVDGDGFSAPGAMFEENGSRTA